MFIFISNEIWEKTINKQKGGECEGGGGDGMLVQKGGWTGFSM